MPIFKKTRLPRRRKEAHGRCRALTLRMLEASMEYDATREPGSFRVTLATVGRKYGLTATQLENFRCRCFRRKTRLPE